MNAPVTTINKDITWSNPPTVTTLSDSNNLTSSLGGFRAESDFANCLLPLLTALKWRGNPRHVAEALPHFADSLDLTGFRNVMAHLNFSSRPVDLRIGQVDARLMPCLFVPKDGAVSVLIGTDGGKVTIFNGDTGGVQSISGKGALGTAFFFSETDPDDASRGLEMRLGWFRVLMQRFRPLIWQIFIVTLVMNVLSLATPLFVMAVYDKVVSSRSVPTLIYFIIGVVLALLGDLFLRAVRARILAHMGARLDNIVGNSVFQRILYLSPTFTERATLGAQVARIKDFESIREFFTGPLAVVLIELPFVVFYVTVIAILGGVVATVPLVIIVLFAILGAVMFPIVKENVAVASKAGSMRQEFLIETLSKMRSIKYTGAEGVWIDRYRELASKSAVGGFHASQINALVGTFSHMLVIMAGIATLGIGVLQIFNGVMTVGSLIASMMLVWRVLSPLQTGFMTAGRLEGVRSSIRQIDGLMKLKPERDLKQMVHPIKRFKGRVTFSRVSLRYSADTDPALVGATFQAEPGEVVCVVGPNGSGKSTVLKLLAGLYQPQAGSVRIDNLDIRQLDPLELRQSVSYVPQNTDLFYGTIAQNMRLAHPLATDDELEWALNEAGGLEDIQALPRGIQTRVGDGTSDQLPTSLIQRINLARAYVKRSPIMLFDEPVNGLDFEGDKQFISTVDKIRGHSTIFIVTHRPSHLKAADRILLFEGGYLRLGGLANEVRDQVPMDML